MNMRAASLDSPHTSMLEICVLMRGISDLFGLKGLADTASNMLGGHCFQLMRGVADISSVINGISFLPGLEAAIRAT